MTRIKRQSRASLSSCGQGSGARVPDLGTRAAGRSRGLLTPGFCGRSLTNAKGRTTTGARDDHYFTDEMMREQMAQAVVYTLVVLRHTDRYGSAGTDKIIWEHARRQMGLRANGVQPIVCPVGDDTGVAGIGVFVGSHDEICTIVDGDPAVQARVLALGVAVSSAGASRAGHRRLGAMRGGRLSGGAKVPAGNPRREGIPVRPGISDTRGPVPGARRQPVAAEDRAGRRPRGRPLGRLPGIRRCGRPSGRRAVRRAMADQGRRCAVPGGMPGSAQHRCGVPEIDALVRRLLPGRRPHLQRRPQTAGAD